METRPDAVELAETAAGWRSAYVHIPFCRRRCPYCDFAVVTADETSMPTERYVDAVVAEIAMEGSWAPLDAVNLGGGTPTSIPTEQLVRILDALDRRFGIADGAEVSIEANPEDITEHYARQLVAAGFTRVSLGAQSFDPHILGVLGRHHAASQVGVAVHAVRAAGIQSVSIDLIFGTEGEDVASWESTVRDALVLEPDHLSAYALTVELGTALSRQVAAGAPAPDPDQQADAYDAIVAATAAAGLVHYEVSNFARPGHVCRYNIATWGQGEYAAFGLGAHGHRGGIRRRNIRRLDAYVDRVDAGVRPEAGREQLDDWGREQERVMIGLRRRCGVRLGDAGERLLGSPEGQRLCDLGIIEIIGDRMVVRNPLLTDAVGREVLSLSPRDC